jgi:hypothetical protein
MTRAALPTFENGNDATQWIVYVDNTTSSPLGQVRSLVWTVAKEKNEKKRVGDSSTYRTATGLNVTGTLELWQDTDDVEIGTFFDQANSVDAAAKTVYAQFYNGEATSSTLVQTYTFTGFDVSSAEGGPREYGSDTYWSFPFTANSVAAT